MKKVLLFLLIPMFSFAQLTLTHDGNGVVSVEYNSADFGIYDPGFDPVLIYAWIDAGQNSASTYFQDEWSNSGSLTSLTWNGVDAHVGTFNLNTHDFANSGGVIPMGTLVNDFNFILRNPAGSSQSANLLSTNFGYIAGSTLSTNSIDDYSSVQLYPNPTKSSFKINRIVKKMSIYDITGKLMKVYAGGFNTDYSYDISFLSKGLYIVEIEGQNNEIITSKLVKE